MIIQKTDSLKNNDLWAMGQLGYRKTIKKNTFTRVFVCRVETLERIFRPLKSFALCFPRDNRPFSLL